MSDTPTTPKPPLPIEEVMARFSDSLGKASEIASPIPCEVLRGVAALQSGHEVLAFRCKCGHKAALSGVDPKKARGKYWCRWCAKLYEVVQEG